VHKSALHADGTLGIYTHIYSVEIIPKHEIRFRYVVGWPGTAILELKLEPPKTLQLFF